MEKAEPVQVRFTQRLRNHRSMWMQDGFKSPHGSLHVIKLDHVSQSLLEVGRIQNRETVALWTLTTVDLFYCIMCGDPREQKFIEVAFGWWPSHMWLHTTLKCPWPHYMTLEVCWDDLWTLSLGLSQFHGRNSWLLCEVALTQLCICNWMSWLRIIVVY
jgi:hypothetical protein